MDRAEAAGLGGAVLLHAGLLALLLLAIRNPPPLPVPAAQPAALDVYVTDEIGLKSQAPPQPDEARAAQAPETGNPQEAAPAAAPDPAPPEPLPPAPAPDPAPATRPVERAPATPPRPANERPQPSRQRPDRAVPSNARQRSLLPRPDVGEGNTQQRARESRLGPDFLKGLREEAKGTAPRPRAPVGAQAMSGIAAAIRRQIQPCCELAGVGPEARAIVTVMRVRFNRDGSVASAQVTGQEGVTDANRSYARQMQDLSRRALMRCAPMRGLPQELYAGGWDDIEAGFKP